MNKLYTFIVGTMALSLMVTSNVLYSQSNCSLIDSITLSVSDETEFLGIVQYGQYGPNEPGYNPVPLEVDEWHYIAITKGNQNDYSVYKNGQLIGEGTYLDNNYIWTRIELGARYYTEYEYWFDGLIDSGVRGKDEGMKKLKGAHAPFGV